MPKKIKRGDPLASTGFVGYVKKVKNERGPFRDKKIRKKVAQCRKNQKKGLFSPVRFCMLRLKVKNERWYALDKGCFDRNWP